MTLRAAVIILSFAVAALLWFAIARDSRRRGDWPSVDDEKDDDSPGTNEPPA